MGTQEAFSRLGIPISTNISLIKSAYRKRLPQHHPEVDPDGFMALHQAYKTALSFAQGAHADTPPTPRTAATQREGYDPEEATAYDSLFASLEQIQTADLAQAKKAVSRKLTAMWLFFFPIPLKCWKAVFTTEVFSLSGDPEIMKQLLNLVLGKMHSYRVFRFLTQMLWELLGHQESEGHAALANATRLCMETLQKQYSHYVTTDETNRTDRMINLSFWYYQALSSTLKYALTLWLLPLLYRNAADVESLLLVLIVFYVVEFCTVHRKYNRKLGFAHYTMKAEDGTLKLTQTAFHKSDVCFAVCYIGSVVHFFWVLGIVANVIG